MNFSHLATKSRPAAPPRPSHQRAWYHVILLGSILLGAAPWCFAQMPSQPLPPEPTPATPTSPTPSAEGSAQDSSKPIELDKVVAIINGDVLLQSDVLEEMQFAALQPFSLSGVATNPGLAGHRLIDRTLILQQMKQQQAVTPVSPEELEKALAELRRELPDCVRYHCESPDGWADLLKHNKLTQQQVEDRWRQRLQILHFIDTRFKGGVRITEPEIQAYYDKTFVPAFNKVSAKPPPLSLVATRVEQILLQQHVTGMLQDWLKSLREQGTVQILDPIYGTSTGENNDGGGAS